jgi:site-specific DNA-methyltransferase (adenine-specific)
MTGFPSESVGLIFTSPPYNVGLRYDGFDDNLPEDKFRQFNFEWLAAAYHVAMNTTRLYVVLSDQMLWWFREAAEQAGWTYVQILIWCKPNFASRSKTISQDWNFASEEVLLFRKGLRTPMLKDMIATTHNWFVEAVPQRNYRDGRIHPAQMPLRLCKKIIARTPGTPVLDPFAGSGQVLRAAKALEREYVGIELVPSVAENAREFVRNGPIKTRVMSQQILITTE